MAEQQKQRAKKIEWTSARYQKLFAATLAAHPEFKINYSKVAGYFGEGATYDSIETRFRAIKKDAKSITSAIASGDLTPIVATPARFKRKSGPTPSTPSSTAKKPRTIAPKDSSSIAAAAPQPPTPSTITNRRQPRARKVKPELSSDSDTPAEELNECDVRKDCAARNVTIGKRFQEVQEQLRMAKGMTSKAGSGRIVIDLGDEVDFEDDEDEEDDKQKEKEVNGFALFAEKRGYVQHQFPTADGGWVM